jgi:hypothetical protein
MNALKLAEDLDNANGFTYLAQLGLASQAATMLRQQQTEIEYWKEKFNKAMEIQEVKPAKYSDAWWKEVEEFNKQLKAQEK